MTLSPPPRAARSICAILVDAQIERGRTYRHARRLLENEDFDRVVVSATAIGQAGLSGARVSGSS